VPYPLSSSLHCLSLGVVLLWMPSGCADPESVESATTVPTPGSSWPLVVDEIFVGSEGDVSRWGWIEIHHTGDTPAELADLVLSIADPDASDGVWRWSFGPVSFPAGSYVILSGPDASTDLGASVKHGDAEARMARVAGQLAIHDGATLLDEVAWIDARKGLARVLDGSVVPDAVGNNDLDRWCDADSSAGQPNPLCVVAGSTCVGPNGVRPIVPVQPGEAFISEVMANPTAVSDGTGEWIEIEIVSTASVDVNGLTISRGSSKFVFESDTCLAMGAGTRLLIGRSAEPMENGGLPELDGVFDFIVANDDLVLVMAAKGITLDVFDHMGSLPSGRALSRDPATGAWCPAEWSYGAGDFGSPGGVNPPCTL
jgi:hypothetical protein